MKIVSLFSVVRGYNIPIYAIIFQPFYFSTWEKSSLLLYWFNLFLLVFASSLRLLLVTSSIILRQQKDLINRPNKTMLDRLVSQNKTESLFFLNFIAVLLVFCFHFRLFFSSGYIFLIWFYSHKIKKIPVVEILTATWWR
jgi:4-hydroxybenzoate polyprenyltransferase